MVAPPPVPVKRNKQEQDLGYKNIQFGVFYYLILIAKHQKFKQKKTEWEISLTSSVQSALYIFSYINMRYSFLHITLHLLLLVLTGTSVLANSNQEVQFKDITITTSQSHLLLFGVLKNDKQKELEQALHSGIPMQFTFFIELLRTRDNWPDEELITIEFNHTLKYDTLKENYQLEIEEQKKRKYTYNNLEQAMQVMNDINGLKVIELSKLLPDNSYELRMKAELYKKTLPMNLHYLIPFISMWDLETDLFTIEFTY
jgi:Domain of unknown function (DUF4390)